MPFTPFPGVARVDLRATLAGKPVQNTLYVNLGSFSEDLASLQEIADQTALTMAGNLPAVTSGITTLGQVIVTGQDSEESPRAIADQAVGVQGTHGGVALPNQNAFALHKNTFSRSRSARGRLYHYGLTSSMLVDANHLFTAEADNILAAWQEIASNILAVAISGITLIVPSYVSGGVPRLTPIGFPFSILSYTDTTVDSMDSRKP